MGADRGLHLDDTIGLALDGYAWVLLDIFGQNHDPLLWPEPYRFQPQRFLDRDPDPYELIPQGGADAATGHRCPGEGVTVALMAAFATRLAQLDYDVPPQDLTISLRRIPALPRSRFQLSNAHRLVPTVR